MTMPPEGNPTKALAFTVCVVVARVAVCALEAVVFHDGSRGCLYWF